MEEDRISALPDEILHHILSLLPSSQISLTSLLSKRWNPLWLSMPNADRISALPNSILIQILSFLPSSQQLLATTSLSKRWRLLRLTIPSLQIGDYGSSDDKNWLHPEFISECLSSQLKMFSFRNYGGKESELKFTKYIVQNGTVLHNVRIYMNSSRNLMEKYRMMQELLLCQRGSAQCQIYF